MGILDGAGETLVLLRVVGLDVNLEVHHHNNFPLLLARHNPTLLQPDLDNKFFFTSWSCFLPNLAFEA